MTNYTDRSAEALLARRAIAEQATPGPWKISSNGLHIVGNINGRYLSEVAQATVITDVVHIVSNDPPTVMSDTNEILRLRAEVQRLEKEADWLARVLVERGHIIGDIISKNFVAEWRDAARKALEEEA